MTERASQQTAARTSLCLLAALVLSCASGSKKVLAQPIEPLAPGFVYGDNFADDPESLMLLNRLKQLTELKHRVVEKEHEITDVQIAIQAMLEAKAQERERTISPDYSEPEALPVPAAMIHHGNQQHPGKRQGTNAVSCKYQDTRIRV
ncbi:hypothetical protein X777_05136 [Ooceraea biroi]|uniref:Secreted protein n=1 Tax=Ooceraea biroi TaxID=2015173 RepID=A0A026WFG6_OOCBI|nr:hypothetical protein X777_05136 [Ooceraea biroi]